MARKGARRCAGRRDTAGSVMKKTIMIVDDDPDFLSSLRITLDAAGYLVVAASSAGEGLALFTETKPDLVVCDIMMERIDAGIRLVRDIRERDGRVPIFLLSDIGRIAAARIDVKELGCSGVIQKPFNAVDILRTVRDAVGG
jgi:CheY-like chemotaxis protein